MESKVSRIGAVGLILSFALSLPFSANAGETGGMATEVTQLANNAELVAQVGEAVQTTSNTLMTAQATMQMLRQLPQSVISQMTNLPIAEVQKLAEAYTVMSRAVGVYQQAEAVLRQAQSDATRLNITPSELLYYKADAAYKYGGIYQQTYEQEQAKLAALAEVSQDVQEQAEQVASIDANVKGIQFIANQNIAIQKTLNQIADSIATANANAAKAANLQATAEGDQATKAAERERLEAESRRQINEVFATTDYGNVESVPMFK